MAPVIRISDRAFERLKQLAEPFVDTPGSVIERLLDSRDEHPPHTAPGTVRVSDANHRRPGREPSASRDAPRLIPNLFFAPAATENVLVSLDRTISLETAKKYLTAPQAASLADALRGRDTFNCWAMTRNSFAVFRAMRPGDHVLVTVKGTGAFNYHGTVLTKLEAEALGRAIWSHTPGLPWALLYVFDELTRIDIPKERVVTALGYRGNYAVPGVIRVDPSRLQTALDRYQDIESMVKTLAT